MDIYKEIIIPERKEMNKIKTVCDICGNDLSEFENGNYKVNRVKIIHEKGNVWPEGSSIYKFEPDICPKCFEDKLVPMLKTVGIEIDYKEDWNF
jgi:uncharacterized protein (DUF983 family)